MPPAAADAPGFLALQFAAAAAAAALPAALLVAAHFAAAAADCAASHAASRPAAPVHVAAVPEGLLMPNRKQASLAGGESWGEGGKA